MTCREHGFDCDFDIVSEDEAELIEFVQTHAKSNHGISPSEEDVRKMIHAA
ncbi:DUF1059 domain-containing protein [Haloprofundus salinisoli]|uniref:DUF1059 domain-containing protein n=1 Tax=Haloprofundus salinisoli TaxID=2876193 RepID=UPI001CCB0C2E|nr:DUF1059 domain-containing protein [Haloprofundus salinisoli]